MQRCKVFVHTPIVNIYTEAVKSWFQKCDPNLEIDYFFTFGEEKNRQEYKAEIARKMNKAREIFLKGDWQWFFNVEEDIVLPEGAIARLLSHNLPIVSGLYRARKTTRKDQPFMCRILDIEGPQDSDDRPPIVVQDFNYGDLIECTLIPFGCLLLQRKVVEEIPFRDEIDVAFSKDASEKKYKLITDTGVLCKHLETGKLY